MTVDTFKKTQLLSFEKSLVLFKRGFSPDTMFFYFYDNDSCEVHTFTHKDNRKHVCPAYTAFDLISMLPNGVGIVRRNGYVSMKNAQMIENVNMLDLLYELLI